MVENPDVKTVERALEAEAESPADPNEIRQVIAIRKDLKMRRGKEIAQGAHASMAWLTHRIQTSMQDSMHRLNIGGSPVADGPYLYLVNNVVLTAPQKAWIEGLFVKVVVQIDSEAEMIELYKAARRVGLEAHTIADAGRTEFKGIATATAIAIGPDTAARLHPVTGHLRLY